MCIMAYVPLGKKISQQKWDVMRRSNPDGWGCMYSDVERVYDKISVKIKTELKIFKGLKAPPIPYPSFGLSPVCFHFRTASSSNVSVMCSHPFFVNDDLAVMMNGNLFEFQFGIDDGLTDTQRFNEFILRKLPDGFLKEKPIRNALEEYCRSNGAKLLFMDNHGHVEIINEKAGRWCDGIWYSNSGMNNYVGYGYSGVYDYGPSETRHKGGLITNLLFRDKNNWKQCRHCNGYFVELVDDCLCSDCSVFHKLMEFCE